MGRAFAGGCLLIQLAGCAAAGPPKLRGQEIKRPISVVVHLAPAAVQDEDEGGVSALFGSVTAGFEQRGLKYRAYTNDADHAPTPRIEIWVMRWWAANHLGTMLAYVKDVLNQAPPAIAAFAMTFSAEPRRGGFVVVSQIFRDGEELPTAVIGYAGDFSGVPEAASQDQAELVGRAILTDVFRSPDRPTFGYCLSEHCR